VSVGSLNLGHADVLVGRNRKDVKNARPDNVPLVAGSTLPIKFRIGDGYDLPDAGSDTGCLGFATLSGQVTFKVTLTPPAPPVPVLIPVLGVTVTLFDESGGRVDNPLNPLTTDEYGVYSSFVDLTPGTYTVCASGTPISGAVLSDATVGACSSGVGFTLPLYAGPNIKIFEFTPPPPPPPPAPPPN